VNGEIQDCLENTIKIKQAKRKLETGAFYQEADGFTLSCKRIEKGKVN